MLAGLTGALLAQGCKPEEAAAAAVWLHGTAGDRCAARLSQTAMLPADLIESFPDCFWKSGAETPLGGDGRGGRFPCCPCWFGGGGGYRITQEELFARFAAPPR